jgi:hypothetical protein
MSHFVVGRANLTTQMFSPIRAGSSYAGGDADHELRGAHMNEYHSKVTRVGRSTLVGAEELDPLADLIGTWIGSRGFELIAVPAKPDFRLIVRPYVEVITFSALGAPVPNRGHTHDIFISGLLYQIRISDLQTNHPLHLENGMWLNLGEGQDPQIVRQASIPHGDVLMALGASSTVQGPPEIAKIKGAPSDTGPNTLPGYTDAYDVFVDGFNPRSPNDVLTEAIAGQDITKTVTLTVSTENHGGIVNIPFVDAEANAISFAAAYWIETVKDPTTGDEFQQLQYSQQTNLRFLQKFGGAPGDLIVWPHVNVNTLLKQ